MRRRVVAALCLCLHFLVSGCFAWGQVPPSTLTPPTARSIQVWLGDSAKVVQWVSVTSDTLTGTPKASRQGPPPETTRWPLAGVDSVRVKHFSTTQSVLAAIGVVGGLSFIIVATGGLCDGGCD